MEILSVVPRGYCQGVVRAIQIAEETVKSNPGIPVTMLGMIVHNQFVVDTCKEMGIQFVEDSLRTRLELLDEIQEGIVIFTAHGVSDEVYEKAKAKGLSIVDATCKDVEKTHILVKNHCQKGDVLFIGKKNHPESEGIVGLSSRVHLITKKEDLKDLPPLENILITSQTTISILEAREIIEACKQLYPEAKVNEEICSATRLRQEAVMKLENIDLLIVVGDSRSNNSKQLKEIGLTHGVKESILIDNVQSLKEDMVKGKARIAITSGSSTPNPLTTQVIDFLKDYAQSGKWELPEQLSHQLF